jgi:hypothetical protein
MATRKPIGDGEVFAPEPTNGAEDQIAYEYPFVCEFTLQGVCPILFHRWNVEAVEEKAAAKKGSAAKKTDNIESYVYRTEDGEIAIPGSYVHGAMIQAARYRQDPRSPRKSAMDLYKAAVASMTEQASLGDTKWDFVDQRRVTIQRAGITRHRPGFNAGWQATFEFGVLLPEYVGPMDFLDVLSLAGKVVGLADHRPTYGRFAVTNFVTREA